MTATRPNPLIELLITLIIPSLILMKWSDPGELGAVQALLLALAFPLAWGARDFIVNRKLNPFAALGLISIVATGGIGLLQLDTQWLALKEAAVPALIGSAVLVSTRTRYPLIKTLLLNASLLDVARLRNALDARGTTPAFETRLQRATWLLAATFFFSAAMNYFLATWIVVSPAGTPEFNQELGRLTLLSYPAIALPSMAMMLFVLYYLARAMRELAGLKLTDLLHNK